MSDTKTPAPDVARMREALETIRDAFWSDGETPADQVADLKGVALAALSPGSEREGEQRAGCADCRRPYGDEHGFPDLIVPLDVWRRISPSGDEGGLLCPSCTCARLHKAGIRCEGAFMSGPIESVSRPTMYALRYTENLREQLGQLEARLTTRPED